MLIFGVFGYLLRKLDYPMAPAVLAIVLGPMAEASVRQSLLMSGGSFTIFFTRPGSAVIMGIALLLFAAPLLKWIKDKIFKPRPAAEEPAEPS
jgi:putative tricarboxylic transport membrane protein